FPDLQRHRLIDVEARPHKDEAGTLPKCRDRCHGGVDTKLAGFIACRRDDASRFAMPHRDRHPPKFRVVALLDRGIEGIHVDVNDLADATGTRLWLLGWLLDFVHRVNHPIMLGRSRHGKWVWQWSP